MDRFSQLIHAKSEIGKGFLQDFSRMHGGQPALHSEGLEEPRRETGRCSIGFCLQVSRGSGGRSARLAVSGCRL
jgi:hypothetical protein